MGHITTQSTTPNRNLTSNDPHHKLVNSASRTWKSFKEITEEQSGLDRGGTQIGPHYSRNAREAQKNQEKTKPKSRYTAKELATLLTTHSGTQPL